MSKLKVNKTYSYYVSFSPLALFLLELIAWSVLLPWTVLFHLIQVVCTAGVTNGEYTTSRGKVISVFRHWSCWYWNFPISTFGVCLKIYLFLFISWYKSLEMGKLKEMILKLFFAFFQHWRLPHIILVGRGSGSTLAHSVSMVCDREIDGSSQLSSICFDHVNNSHSNCESPTCSS